MTEHASEFHSMPQNIPFLTGLLGIFALVLPFSGHISPWDATGGALLTHGFAPLFDQFQLPYVLLSAPFLLAIPISVATLQFRLTGRIAPLGWLAAYALAFIAAEGTLSLLSSVAIQTLTGERLPIAGWGLFGIFLPIACVIASAGIVLRNLQLEVPHDRNAVIAMQLAYIGGVALPLLLFFGRWDVGAYVTVASVAVYIMQIGYRNFHPRD